MTLRAAIVTQALRWVGTPYHHQGRVFGVGVDCAGLLTEVYRACGLVPAIDTGNYAIDHHLHHSSELMTSFLDRYAQRTEGPPLPGDVVAYRFGRVISHAAIVVDWPLIIHAARRNRQVLVEDGQAGEYAPPRECVRYVVNGVPAGVPT